MQKIRLENNWGRLSYWLGEVRINDAHLLDIEWPDGTREESCEISSHTYRDSVGDMGVETWFKTTRFFLKRELHGIPVEIPLEKVKAKIVN